MKYISLLLWIGVLTLTGTYFRVRAGDSIEALQTDWLVIAQLSVCSIGSMIAVVYVFRQKRWYLGVKYLCIFMIMAIVSAIFNPYPIKVFGYWILLVGACLLTMQLIYSVQSLNELKQIENAWLITITILIIKDALTGFFLIPEHVTPDNLARLGMGITHANVLSFTSAIAFWISFKDDEFRVPSLWWIPRSIFLLVIILARTRMSIFCFLLGGIIKIWYNLGSKKRGGWYLRLGGILLFVYLLLGFVFGLLNNLHFFSSIFDIINRGQSATEILSATGRTTIWFITIGKIFDNLINFIFGYGYGMSRFILNDGVIKTYFYIDHAHNAYLEVLLSMGFIGFCSLMALIFYGLKWIINFDRLKSIYSYPFTLRAVIVISMILIFSITEASIAMKIGPVFVIFIFYILALDRRNVLQRIDGKEFGK